MSATPRRICSILTAGSVKSGAIIEAGQDKPTVTLTPIQCMGPVCHHWMHDHGADPETGDCVFTLAARFGAIAAGQAQACNDNLVTLGNIVGLLAQKAGVNVAPVTPTVAQG